MARSPPWFSVFLVFLVSSTYGDESVIVEKGGSASVKFEFRSDAQSAKCSIMTSSSNIDISSCSFGTTPSCVNTQLATYQATISSGVNKTIVLNISAAKTSETTFLCESDTHQKVIVTIEVYARTTKPVCEYNITDTYVEYSCKINNGFPSTLIYIPYREEDPFADTDFDSSFKQCLAGKYGSGTDGDYAYTCVFRVPMENMLPTTTFTLYVYPNISSSQIINKTIVASDPVYIEFTIPRIRVLIRKCPEGPGVDRYKETILIGTEATCKCEMEVLGSPPGFARWSLDNGDIHGFENVTDRSSTLTISYNSTEIDKTYKCRAVAPYKQKSSSYVEYTPTFHTPHVIIEKRQSTSFQCSFAKLAKSVTWRFFNKDATYLTTCNAGDNTCKDEMPSLYQGSISSSGNNLISSLKVTSVKINETDFTCQSDVGPTIHHEIEPYAWPTKLACSQTLDKDYANYTCSTDNVYSGYYVNFYRREAELTAADWNVIDGSCERGPFGSGTDGEYNASCIVRVPMEILLPINTFYMDMIARVYSGTVINRTATVGDDMITTLTIPTVVVDKTKCPVGPGVQGDSILIETAATCKCEMSSSGFPPSFARWFTQDNKIVGAENATDMSSTLTIMYNSAEPIQVFECRPITSFKVNTTAVAYTAVFTTTPVLVEKGHPISLQCSFPITVSSIKWQLLSGSPAVSLSTCSFVTNTCSDNMPASYRGSILSSATNRVMGLTITSAGTNETKFFCVADNQLKSYVSKLEVYAWPTKPRCEQILTKSYVEYNCTTDNVYPGINAVLHRRELDFTQSDFAPLNTFCLNGIYGSGTNGDMMATCKWRVPIDKVLQKSSVFVETTAQVSNLSMVNKSAAVSDDITTTLTIPEVVVNKNYCPLGYGVRNGSVLDGTLATCKCEMKSNGIPSGFARWFTTEGMNVVGVENMEDMSSTLYFSSNSSVSSQGYECWPIIPFKAATTKVVYKPTFISSTASSSITGLQTMVIILIALTSWAVSDFS